MADRFSGVSDELAYHILSFLNVEDLGRLIAVSKRFKSLCVYVPPRSSSSLTTSTVDDHSHRCVSAPCLIVDNRNHAHDPISRQHFIQFVGKLLTLRANSATPIQHFTLIWCFQGQGLSVSPPTAPSHSDEEEEEARRLDYPCDSEEALVSRWLLNLSTHPGVERLSINTLFYNNNPERDIFNFPSHLLSSKSLKQLSICCNSRMLLFHKFSIRISDDGSSLNSLFSQLQSLTLQSARIVPDDWLFKAALGKLCFLEYMYLYDCSGLKTISISHPYLKQLKIINGKQVELYDIQVTCPKLQKFDLTWYPAHSSGANFLLRSPSLQHFVWYGYFVRDYVTCQDWRDLQCAALYLTLPPGTNVASLSKYNYMQGLLPIFAKASKFLRLHAKTIEVLFQLSHLTPVLNAARNLAIHYCVLTDDQVPIIASFLKMIYRLETLYLMSSQATFHGSSMGGNLKEAVLTQGFRFGVEYWESQQLTFIDELKKVAVEVHNDEGNDVELVKYLLKHATRLQNLTIVCAPSLASSISEQLKVFMKAPAKVNFCLKRL